MTDLVEKLKKQYPNADGVRFVFYWSRTVKLVKEYDWGYEVFYYDLTEIDWEYSVVGTFDDLETHLENYDIWEEIIDEYTPILSSGCLCASKTKLYSTSPSNVDADDFDLASVKKMSLFKMERIENKERSRFAFYV